MLSDLSIRILYSWISPETPGDYLMYASGGGDTILIHCHDDEFTEDYHHKAIPARICSRDWQLPWQSNNLLEDLSWYVCGASYHTLTMSWCGSGKVHMVYHNTILHRRPPCRGGAGGGGGGGMICVRIVRGLPSFSFSFSFFFVLLVVVTTSSFFLLLSSSSSRSICWCLVLCSFVSSSLVMMTKIPLQKT